MWGPRNIHNFRVIIVSQVPDEASLYIRREIVPPQCDAGWSDGELRAEPDDDGRIWLYCVDRFQPWATCSKRALDWNAERSLKPVTEPLQDIHFLVQDRDDDGAVNDNPEDVVTLAPLDADPARQLRQ
jgi:hypothetical protein